MHYALDHSRHCPVFFLVPKKHVFLSSNCFFLKLGGKHGNQKIITFFLMGHLLNLYPVWDDVLVPLASMNG